MRDPNRISEVLAAVEAQWRKNPDLRFTQLITNVTRLGGYSAGPDITGFYNIEDDSLLWMLSKYGE